MRVIAASFAVVTGCALAVTNPPDPERPEKLCNSSEATPIMDGAWAVIYGVSAVVAINDLTSDYPDEGASTILVLSGLMTAVHTFSAIKGWSNVQACAKRERELTAAIDANAAPPIQQQRRKDAWEATKRAQEAARAGDCATVSTLGEIVFNIDPEFHAAVFVRDAGIKQCLTPMQPLVPATP